MGEHTTPHHSTPHQKRNEQKKRKWNEMKNKNEHDDVEARSARGS